MDVNNDLSLHDAAKKLAYCMIDGDALNPLRFLESGIS